MNLDLTKQTDRVYNTHSAQQHRIFCRVVGHAEHWEFGSTVKIKKHSTEKFNCTKPFVDAHLVFLDLEKTLKIHTPAQLHDGCILAAVEVKLAQEAIFYIVQHVTIHGISWTFPFQFEHQHPTVMA